MFFDLIRPINITILMLDARRHKIRNETSTYSTFRYLIRFSFVFCERMRKINCKKMKQKQKQIIYFISPNQSNHNIYSCSFFSVLLFLFFFSVFFFCFFSDLFFCSHDRRLLHFHPNWSCSLVTFSSSSFSFFSFFTDY